MKNLTRIGVAVLICLEAGTLQAQIRSYTIDENLSFISIVPGSGSGGSTIDAATPLGALTLNVGIQSDGSLTANYDGAILADRTGGNIQFIPGSNVDAIESLVNYSPLANGDSGGVPADYGGRVSFLSITANFAGRNFVFDLASNSLAVSGGGNFDAGGITASFVDGSVAYNIPPILTDPEQKGAESIIGELVTLAGLGSISSNGLEETITIPFTSVLDLDLEGNSAHLEFTGTLVATAIVPEASGFALASIGLAGITGFMRRRRARLAMN